MQEAIISASAALLGTAIGVCTTLVIHRIDRKTNERKIINESIHYLLEVYYHVNRINPEKITKAYFKYYFKQIKKSIPGLDDKSMEIAEKQSVQLLNASLIPVAQQSYEELKVLGNRYESILNNLATILPVNAYFLRGKNKLAEVINLQTNVFENIKDADIEIDDADILKDLICKMQPYATKNLISEYIKDLESELRELLKNTDCYNRRKGRKVIKGLKTEVLTADDKHNIDLIVATIADAMKSSGKQNKAQ